MKLPLNIMLAAVVTLRVPAQELTTSVLDAAGGMSAGGDVEIAGSLGGFAGFSSDAGSVTARAGFPGQIYDSVSVAIIPGSATLQENDARLFTAEVVCDDNTLLPAKAVVWSVDNPFLSVSPGGELSTGLLPEAFAATLTATAGSVAGSVAGTAMLTITDTDPDNYRDYAADGLPDAWQILHFGYLNPDAAPTADPDHDGQNNQTEYLAGTNPLDAASLLQFAFSSTGPPAPGSAHFNFSPYLPDRTYTVESTGTLEALWTPLPGPAGAGPVPGEGIITDTAAIESRKLYRLKITQP